MDSYLNYASNAKEQQVGDYDAEALPIEHPPEEEINHHEVHHERAEDDVTIGYISILT
jgi:hypothetical protein